eukprot:gene5152-6413_t
MDQQKQQQSQQQQQQPQQQQQRNMGYQRMFKRLLQTRSVQQKTLVPERIISSYKVYGWLIQHDPAYESTAFRREVLVAIDEIFDIVLAILDMMKCSSNLLIPIIIYADKFVHRSGIKHNQLFNLLLTSTVVSLKFWSESTQVNNAIIAEIFNFSLKDMNLMERRFLTGVDYNLFLTINEVTHYLIDLYENQQVFLSSFKHPFDNPPQLCRKPIDLIQYQQQLIQQQINQQQIAQQQAAAAALLQQQQQQFKKYHHIHHHQSQVIHMPTESSVSHSYNNVVMTASQMVSPMC